MSASALKARVASIIEAQRMAMYAYGMTLAAMRPGARLADFVAPVDKKAELEEAIEEVRDVFRCLTRMLEDSKAYNIAPLAFEFLGVDGSVLSSKQPGDNGRRIVEALSTSLVLLFLESLIDYIEQDFRRPQVIWMFANSVKRTLRMCKVLSEPSSWEVFESTVSATNTVKMFTYAQYSSAWDPLTVPIGVLFIIAANVFANLKNMTRVAFSSEGRMKQAAKAVTDPTGILRAWDR